VLAVTDGSAAWQALQQPDAPRLVILDWMMPGLDGLDVLRLVRALETARPPYIIMLTAKDDKADIIAGIAAGANDYLSKPYDPGELFARLEAGQRMLLMQDRLAAKAEESRRLQADLHVLTARLQAVREEERASLSRELHDSFGQHLTALQMDLIWMERRLHAAKVPTLAGVRDRIVAMVPMVERLTEQTQTLCAALRPNVLFELGLVAAIEWQAEDTAKRNGLDLSLALPADELELQPDCALALFRIVQEALTNVVRHARASRVGVRLESVGGGLELEIQDNGLGFATDSTTGPRALGLLGMRERAIAFGGTVEFLNSPGMGGSVRVRMPCDQNPSPPTERA
jgi:signal transduction histidine kinase